MNDPLAAYSSCKGVCVLCKVYYEGSSVGHARIQKEGLFYKFICSCTPPDSSVYRISVDDGENRRDLGICVPQGDIYTLTARVPCKYLKGDSLHFELTDKKAVAVPVRSGEPFDHLEQLENARFHEENGQAEINLSPVPDPQDSDPNQEFPNILAWQ